MQEAPESTLVREMIRGARQPEVRANEALAILLRDQTRRTVFLDQLSTITGVVAPPTAAVSLFAERGHVDPVRLETNPGGPAALPSDMKDYLGGIPRPDFTVMFDQDVSLTIETKVDSPFHGENQPGRYLGLYGGTPLLIIAPSGRLEYFRRDLQRLVGAQWSRRDSGERHSWSAEVGGTTLHLASWATVLGSSNSDADRGPLDALADAVESVGLTTGPSAEVLSRLTVRSIEALTEVAARFRDSAATLLDEKGIKHSRGNSVEWSTIDFTIDDDGYYAGYFFPHWVREESDSPFVVNSKVGNTLIRELHLKTGTTIQDCVDSLILEFSEWLSKRLNGLA